MFICNKTGWNRKLRAHVCGALLVVFPIALVAQDTAGAMLTAHGDIAVNGRPVANSQAVLPGDLTVTQKDGGGNLTQGGTNAMLGTDTALRYETTYAVLERGGVSVNTQRGFAVQAGCWTVKPQQWDAWTDFAVSYAEGGQVLIQARGADVRVYGRAQRPHDKDKKSADVSKLVDADRDRDVNGAPLGNLGGTAVQEPQTDRGELLRAGQEAKREACPSAAEQARQRPTRGGAASAASSGPLNSQTALYVGAGVAGGVTVLFLIHHDDPVSPAKP